MDISKELSYIPRINTGDKMKNGIVITLAFIIGLSIGLAANASSSPSDSREATWKELKAIDDEILVKAGEGIGVTSDNLAACGRFDIAAIEANTDKLKTISDQVMIQAADRKGKLAELGY